MSWTVREPVPEGAVKLQKGFATYREIVEALPHGSGIDSSWSVDLVGRGVNFYNSYHAMNENGFYCGWHDFYIRIAPEPKTTWYPLTGPCDGKAQIMTIRGDTSYRVVGLSGRMADVKDWIYDMLHDDLGKMGIPVRGFTRNEVVDVLSVHKRIKEMTR
jgi:hypothetical protein